MATAGRRELEAKFTVADPALAQRLATAGDIVPGFVISDARLTRHEDVYYDTAALRLLRRGYVLRVRMDDGRAVVGIKGLATTPDAEWQDRYEDEHAFVPMGEPPFEEAWPASTRAFVSDLLGERAILHRLIGLRQTRIKRVLTPRARAGDDAPPAPVVEISIDEVAIESARADAHAEDDSRIDFQTVEVELLPAGAPKQLRQVVRVLRAAQGLAAETQSKLELALARHAASVPGAQGGETGIRPDMHIAEACRLIWRVQLGRMLFAEHGVRDSNDPEHLHELRIAIRRARTVEKLFGDYFRAKALRPHFKALRRLGRLAGAARDLDVALENIHDYRKHAKRAHRADLKEIEQAYQQRRRDAYAKLVEYLDSAAHEAFVAGFVQFTATPGAGVRRSLVDPAPPTPITVCHILPTLLQARFARIRAFSVLFAGDVPPAVNELHALRIECKYLRYALEFGRHLLGAEGEELIAHLKALQDLLGGINDAAVEGQRLAEWQAAGMDNPAVRGRLANLQQRTQALSADAPAVFAAFIDEANRRRLALAIARI